jgi:hypothetical protein
MIFWLVPSTGPLKTVCGGSSQSLPDKPKSQFFGLRADAGKGNGRFAHCPTLSM